MIKSRRMKWAGHIAAQERKARKPRYKWEDNIKMYVRGIGWGSIDWIHVAQDRDQWQTLVNKIINFQVT
jgi:hypothetical protein